MRRPWPTRGGLLLQNNQPTNQTNKQEFKKRVQFEQDSGYQLTQDDQKANEYVKYLIMKIFRLSDRKECLSIGQNGWQTETMVIKQKCRVYDWIQILRPARIPVLANIIWRTV